MHLLANTELWSTPCFLQVDSVGQSLQGKGPSLMVNDEDTFFGDGAFVALVHCMGGARALIKRTNTCIIDCLKYAVHIGTS